MSEFSKLLSNFSSIVEHVIFIEGGYSDNPMDSGGKTKFGITEALARQYGFSGGMKDLSKDEAIRIYKAEFWDVLKLDEFSYDIAFELFDQAVNTGTKRAAIFLQRALNVLNRGGTLYKDLKVDGSIGSATIAAYREYIRKREESVLLTALNCLQGNFYIELAERREKDEAFLYGWIKHRVVQW